MADEDLLDLRALGIEASDTVHVFEALGQAPVSAPIHAVHPPPSPPACAASTAFRFIWGTVGLKSTSLGTRLTPWKLSMPELRRDPVTGRWVIISTVRQQRPHDFHFERAVVSGREQCPFCPGHEGMTPPEVLAYLRGRAQADLKTLDAFLASSEYLLPCGPSIADISCAAYLFWLSQAGLSEAEYPNLQRWLSALRGLPGWRHPDEALKPEAGRE